MDTATTTTSVLSIQARARLKKELVEIQRNPPPGIAAYLQQTVIENDDDDRGGKSSSDGDLSMWVGEVTGPEDSPFENIVFIVHIKIPTRYPFEPPHCRFIIEDTSISTRCSSSCNRNNVDTDRIPSLESRKRTRITSTIPYHPNIDYMHGHICLNILKSQPSGNWSPALNIRTLLLSLQNLLSSPNPDDGLEAEISNLYKNNPDKWFIEAKKRCNVNNKRQGKNHDCIDHGSSPRSSSTTNNGDTTKNGLLSVAIQQQGTKGERNELSSSSKRQKR